MGRRLSLLIAFLVLPTAIRAEPLDLAGIKVIPRIDVLRRADAEMAFGMGLFWRRSETIMKLHAESRPVQALFWLMVLDQSYDRPDRRDVLDAFFSDRMRTYAPLIRDASLVADMTHEAELMTDGINLFRPPFPIGGEELKYGPEFRVQRYDATAMKTLSAHFPDRADYDDRVLTFVASRPDLVAWIEARRASLTDEDRFLALMRNLPQPSDVAEMASWPEPYRVLSLAYSAYTVFADYDEDPMADYLADTDGDRLSATVVAFRAIGRDRSAEALERAIALFPKPFPATSEERRKLEAADGFALSKRLVDLGRPLSQDFTSDALQAYAARQVILPR